MADEVVIYQCCVCCRVDKGDGQLAMLSAGEVMDLCQKHQIVIIPQRICNDCGAREERVSKGISQDYADAAFVDLAFAEKDSPSISLPANADVSDGQLLLPIAEPLFPATTSFQ